MLNPNQQHESDRKSMYTVSFIFCIISCATVGWFLITLAWLIPMTIMMDKARKQVGTPEEQSHIGLAVCALLFVNLIAGIFAIIGACFFDPAIPYQGSAYDANRMNMNK